VTDLDALVWGNLTRLDELGVLDADERVVDYEQVGWRTAPGLLIVSDRRVVGRGKLRAEEIARAILDQRAALVE
jgi:hypothetical protein